MGELPPFEAFFAAVRQGMSPLPWQTRLAALVADKGWPQEIGVPTGLGKTGCIDIALWSLAGQAAASERTLPTRIWYVVNRRLLVDTAYQHGMRLAGLLADPDQLGDVWPQAGAEHKEALEAVSSALSALGGLGVALGPLHTVRLRGGAELGARPPDPSQPTLVFATVALFASRWLFRGYGSSRGMRPIDAALAGTDSLVLLDEAHLARPLAALRSPLVACDPGDPTTLLLRERCSPRFVAMTATGSSDAPFDLGEDDLAHPVVNQRIHAAKPACLVESSKKKLAADLAAQALGAMDSPGRSSCLVFANTPSRAREVARLLSKDPSRRVVLVTGRIRDREADVLRRQLLDPLRGIPAGRDQSGTSIEALWVVATQTLEVGADLDADVLVTETAGVRALVQRLGRCNRLGSRPNPQVVICHAPDLEQPLYGDEPAALWQRLCGASEALSLSPAEVGSILGPPADDGTRGAEPLPALVWEWVKTSMPPPDEAPVEAYFAPRDDTVARVSVCWRAHRPEPGVSLQPPISAAEAVDIPIGEVRALLEEHVSTALRRLAPDRASLEGFAAAELRPGDVVVLSSSDGGYDQFGWNPDADIEVLDVSLLAARALPLSACVVTNLVSDPTGRKSLLDRLGELETDDDETPEPAADHAWAEDWLVALRSAQPHPWCAPDEWATWCDRWEVALVRPVGDVPALLGRPPAPRATVALRADAFEELSFDASSVALDEHLGSVGETAATIARHVGLPAGIVEAVELAGRFHDLGKADPRFQRWLDPRAASTELLAKSSIDRFRIEAARIASSWPRGARHEAVSGQLLRAWLDEHDLAGVDAELVFHLVVSHHGYCRPMVPVADDPGGTTVVATIDGTELQVVADLGAPDWEQPARFRTLCERYGYWGLALLEAVVRQADQAVSSAVVA